MTALSRWDPARHPRGPHGRFARGPSKVTASERVTGNKILDDFKPKKFENDFRTTDYLVAHTPKLTAAQRGAVDRYTGDGFLELNKSLRAGTATDPDIPRLDSAMRPLPDDLLLTRHVDANAFGFRDQDVKGVEHLVGRVISDKAYSSTSLGSPVAGGIGGVTLRIIAPKGTPALMVAGVSKYPHEREVLLARGQRMVIAKITRNSRGGYDAHAVLLPHDGTDWP